MVQLHYNSIKCECIENIQKIHLRKSHICFISTSRLRNTNTPKLRN